MESFLDASVFDTSEVTAEQLHKAVPTLDQALAVYDRVVHVLDMGAVCSVSARFDPAALEQAVNHRFRLAHQDTTVRVLAGEDRSAVMLAIRDGKLNMQGIS